MRLGAVGEAEVVVIDDVHHRRVGRTAQFVGRVRRVESLCPRLFELGGIADAVRERRLSAAVDAAARTRHDLDEIVLLLARLDLLDDLARVGKPRRDRDFDRVSGDEIGRLFDRFGAAHAEEVEHLKAAVQHMSRRPQRRLHDAARRAEDRAAARRQCERIVKFFVGKLGELDARGLDHARKFARRQRRVDVVIHLLARALVFLRRARNDADDVEVLGIDAVLFAPIAFEQRAEHLLRRLAGRKVRDHLGIGLFDELDPPRTARREHRQRLARLDAVDQLARLLHDREVGGDVHVEHRVRTQPADRRDHLALDVGADRHVERLAQRRPDRRRGEEHHLFGRIGKRRPYVARRRPLGQRADRARDDALPAAHARRIDERSVERAADVDVEAPADRTYRVDALLAARGDATHAIDAFVVVADDVRRRHVDGQDEVLALEPVLVDVVAERQFLKFAIVVALARKTLLFVLAENEFERQLARTAALLGVGAHLHALRDRIDARRDKPSRARRLDHAHAARTDAADVFEIAQRRDLDMSLARRLQYRRPLGDGDRYAVDLEIDHFLLNVFHTVTSSRSRRTCNCSRKVRT